MAEVVDPTGWCTVSGPGASGMPVMSRDAAMKFAERMNIAYKQGQQDARSLAQPPSSEVVEAGNAMRKAVCDLIIIENAMEDDDGKFHLDDLNNAWLILAQAAMSWDAAVAHPKDTAPTVEDIMHGAFAPWYRDSVIPWLKGCDFSDTRSIDQDLRTRLTKLLTKP